MHTSTYSRTLEEHRVIVKELAPPPYPPQPVRQWKFGEMTVYTPMNVDGPYPTFLFVPGNAFVASEQYYTEYVCSNIAGQTKCQVIAVNQPLAPEFPFPRGLEDLYKTLCLLFERKPSALKIDFNNFAIGGYSSGGNFAALLCLMARFKGFPIAREILISPTLDLARVPKGFEEFESLDTAISEGFVKWFVSKYLPNHILPSYPFASPLWINDRCFKGNASVNIFYGEHDRFRGDSECFSVKLKGQCVPVQPLMFKGENHGFLWHNPEVLRAVSAHLISAISGFPVPRLIPCRSQPSLKTKRDIGINERKIKGAITPDKELKHSSDQNALLLYSYRPRKPKALKETEENTYKVVRSCYQKKF